VDDPLIVALAITLVGMVLLFLALAFFYGLLSFIASALHEKEPPAPAPLAVDEAAQDQPAAAEDLMLQAAAIAVALARAEGDDGLAPVAAGPAGRALSPWWLLHQGRRMAASSSPWRTS
jgi:Na+-transporting methylmalonyl-CoA/oxaloacetate decarboxylase gamma subunit